MGSLECDCNIKTHLSSYVFDPGDRVGLLDSQCWAWVRYYIHIVIYIYCVYVSVIGGTEYDGGPACPDVVCLS